MNITIEWVRVNKTWSEFRREGTLGPTYWIVPGWLIRVRRGEKIDVFLVGHMNPHGGECGDCPLVEEGDIVEAYSGSLLDVIASCTRTCDQLQAVSTEKRRTQ